MRHRYALLFIAGILLLSLATGCAVTSSFQKAPIDADKALVYVFRPESIFARGEMFKLEVNGSMQGMLLNNSYLPVYVNPGDVTVAVFQNSLIAKPLLADLTLKTEAGSTYYVKVKPGLAWTVEVLQLDSEQGAEEIRSAVFYESE